MIRTIVFDIDGTLVDHARAERAAIESIYDSVRETIDYSLDWAMPSVYQYPAPCFW
ncbi:MAG: hypothetical protein AB1700_07960 [Bacillota bacterium]